MNSNQFSIYRRLGKIIPKDGISIVTAEHDFERGQRFVDREEMSRLDILREIKKFFWSSRNKKTDFERMAEITEWSDIELLLSEEIESHGICILFIGSIDEYQEFRLEEERQRLEAKAARLAGSIGVRIDSFDFIRTLQQKIAAQRLYREGMREDGLCIGFGVTAEQWYEEFNYSANIEDDYEEILDFLHSYCPLLMARHQESMLRNKNVNSL